MPGIRHLDFKEPEIYKYLSAVIDSVLLKNVVKRNNIRDVALLEKIMQLIFDNIGNVLSGRKIVDYFKNERRTLGHETVKTHLLEMVLYSVVNAATAKSISLYSNESDT